VRTVEVDFNRTLMGWAAGFADYPRGQEAFYELMSGHRPLPAPLLQQGRMGFYISGNNHSDDLFMYLRGRIDGLRPSTRHGVEIRFDLATDAPSGCIGVGGPPGEGVTAKAGAAPIEPLPERLGTTIDKGNQTVGGRDAIVVGHIANSNTDCANPRYEIKRLSSAGKQLAAQSAADGTLWIFIGTDSGFEGKTSLYYTAAQITLTAE
jgi:hypothetical protein